MDEAEDEARMEGEGGVQVAKNAASKAKHDTDKALSRGELDAERPMDATGDDDVRSTLERENRGGVMDSIKHKGQQLKEAGEWTYSTGACKYLCVTCLCVHHVCVLIIPSPSASDWCLLLCLWLGA